MASSSSQILLLLLYNILFASPITSSYPLQTICKHTRSPDFCLQILGPHRNSSLQQLDQIVIDAAISSVAKTTAKIQSLLSVTMDPEIRIVYSVCSDHYRAAARALNAANKKLKSGEYRDLITAASSVSKDATSCRLISSIASQRLPTASDNDYLYLISNVFAAVSRILFGSG